MNRMFSLIVLTALILLVGSTFYAVVAPFLLPLFMAAVFAVVCRPLYRRCLVWTGGRSAGAAGLVTLAVTLTFVGPVVVLTILAATQLYGLADRQLGGNWQQGLDQIFQAIEPLRERLSQIVPGGLTDEQVQSFKNELLSNLRSLASTIAGGTFSLASSTVGWLISLAVWTGMFLTGLYYFLADGPGILAALETLIPLPVPHQRQLREQFGRTVRAVVLATFLAAFAQGVATALALQVCGFGHFLVFAVVGTVASLIPLAGAWMVWGPCAAWLVVNGHWATALALGAWGLVVVGLLDNLIKMYVLQSEADLHPLIAFVSVVGALQVMGLWGVFIGPIIASCLFALVQMFNQELRLLSAEGATPPAEPSVPGTVTPETNTPESRVVPASVPVSVAATPTNSGPTVTAPTATVPSNPSPRPARRRKR